MSVAFIVLAAGLLLYAGVFPLLAFDAASAVLARAQQLPPADVLYVITMEISRGAAGLIGWLVAAFLIVRAHGRADARALALFVLWLNITLGKAFSGTGFSGSFQQWLALGLLDAGVPRAVMRWCFGRELWPVWLALAALIRFSLVFPRPLLPTVLAQSGQQDRRGFMRGAGVAGADIGAFFRTAAMRALHSGYFEPRALWSVALVMVVLHTALPVAVWSTVALSLAGLVCGSLAITNLRAGYTTSDPHNRGRIRWLLSGVLAGVWLFLISALVLLVFESPLATIPAGILLTLAPALLMIGLALAVLARGTDSAEVVLARTVRHGALACVLTLAFAFMQKLLTLIADGLLGLSPALAGWLALFSIVLLFVPIQRVTDRLRERILESDGRSAASG